MALKDLEVTDMLKIGAMILLYTVYVTWWASGIQSELNELKLHITEHLGKGDHPVFQTQAIMSLLKTQELNAVTLLSMSEEHIRCKIVIDDLKVRLINLEQIEAFAHKREYK
jgi:hypothetical protein